MACYKFFDINICSCKTGNLKNSGNFLPLTLHVKMTSQFLKICTMDPKNIFGLVVCEANSLLQENICHSSVASNASKFVDVYALCIHTYIHTYYNTQVIHLLLRGSVTSVFWNSSDNMLTTSHCCYNSETMLFCYYSFRGKQAVGRTSYDIFEPFCRKCAHV